MLRAAFKIRVWYRWQCTTEWSFSLTYACGKIVSEVHALTYLRVQRAEIRLQTSGEQWPCSLLLSDLAKSFISGSTWSFRSISPAFRHWIWCNDTLKHRIDDGLTFVGVSGYLHINIPPEECFFRVPKLTTWLTAHRRLKELHMV